MKLHRNSQKRLVFDQAVYFITCKTKKNFPYFKEKIFCDVFVKNLRLCKKFKGFWLFGWVLCYDHFHLQLMPSEEFDLSKIMQSLKRNISHNINYILGNIEGANNYSRLQFREMLINYKQQFLQKYPNQNPFPKFRWQKTYQDHYIRSQNDFDIHLNYIEYNPLKHNLPNDWPYIFTNPDYGDLMD